KDDVAPSSRGHNGIVDLTQFDKNYENYYSSNYLRRDGESAPNEYVPAKQLSAIAEAIKAFPNKRVGNNVFMLSQQLMTAQGIKSSRTVNIEKNKIYALSVELYTYAIHGAGVSLILTGSDGKDIVIKGISAAPSDNVYIGSTPIDPDNNGYVNGDPESNMGASTDGWVKYTFYIQGNQFKDYNYNVGIWLGTDGTNSNNKVQYRSYSSSSSSSSGSDSTTYRANGTFSNGWVFVDELNLEELTALPSADSTTWGVNEDQTLDCSKQDGYTALIVDLTTDNLFGTDGAYILSDENGTHKAALDGVTALGEGTPYGWTSKFDVTDESNPIITGAISEGIVDLSSKDAFNAGEAYEYPALPYETISKNAYMIASSKSSYYEIETAKFTIAANQAYRISLWVKTVDVSSTSGAYIYLLDKSGEEDATLTSFTKINTKDYDEYTNDWCEVTMIVRGAADKDTEVALKFTLGTGNRWAASTLTSGQMYITNMNMSTITYANFKDTSTGTYVKSVDMSESFNYTFQNGQFDDFDLDDENLVENKSLDEQDFAATPDNWSISDNTLAINGKENKDNVVEGFAGIIALSSDYKTSHQAETATKIGANIFNNFYNGITLEDEIALRGEKAQVLAIGSLVNDCIA
ncbi:MAG: hypothetical protein K2M36_01200, partial [Clostridia bacterium]|nr:hypothetical protein [Clostridia bacterium]